MLAGTFIRSLCKNQKNAIATKAGSNCKIVRQNRSILLRSETAISSDEVTLR